MKRARPRAAGTTALLAAAACLALLLFQCSDKKKTGSDSAYAEEGMASYYGAKFHGKKTASGEKFNMYAMTAAHRSLPFGAKVKVTNLDNGKQVVVRINDRGPWKEGRVIDLSRAAAAKLDMIDSGLARVRIEVVNMP